MNSRAQPDRAEAGYVAVTFDGMTLVFPVHDAPAVKDTDELGGIHADVGAMGFGTLEHDGQLVPLYRLSKSLHPEPGPMRPFVLIALAGKEPFGLLCDKVRTVPRNKVRSEPLPACMQSAGTLDIAIAELPDGVGFHCPGRALSSIAIANLERSRGDR
ncbi:MAG: hypothetical protein ACKVQU_33925 [Burkholderiales bacterium]